MRKLVLGLAAVSVLAGCSAFDDDDPNAPAELVDFDEIVEIDREWSHSTGDQHEYHAPLRLSENLGVIYAASTEGDVVALEREEGDEKWEVELDEAVSGGVSANRGLVMLGTPKGEVVALSATDGTEKWRVKMATEVIASPVSSGRIVVVHGSDGIVTALDARDGSELWTYKEILPALTMQGVSEPVINAGMAIVGFASGKLSVLKLDTGVPVWEALVAVPSGKSDIERMVDIDGEPVISGQTLVAASMNGSIKAFNLRSGRVTWEADASTSKALSSGFGNVYMSSLDGIVKAYRLDTGAQAWINDQMKNRGLSAPVVWSSYLAVGDRDGYVHVLSQVDGSFVGRYDIGEPIRSLMASKGKDLYVLDDSGTITALTFEE